MSLANAIVELEKLFDIFNIKYYDSFLVKPIITIQSVGNKPTLGYCTLQKVWKTTEEDKYEICIAAEALMSPIEDICIILLHEMVHLYNEMIKVKDCSANGVYHNKKYKLEAEKRGLIISKTEKVGWSYTELTEESKSFISSLTIDYSAFDLQRIKFEKVKKDNSNKVYKFICPACQQIVYCKNKEATIICGECEILYLLEE